MRPFRFASHKEVIMRVTTISLTLVSLLLVLRPSLAQPVQPTPTQAGRAGGAVVDPGVRGGAPGAGGPLNGLTQDEQQFFNDGLKRFATIEVVTGGANNGLGPRFNSNACLSCHSQPAPGGTSPAMNPLIAVSTLNGAKNMIPWFIAQNGPVREARFKKSPDGSNDGEVHDLFVITGRSDAVGCNIAQQDFLPAGNPLTGQGGNRKHYFLHPHARVWQRADRSHPRFGDPGQHVCRVIPQNGVAHFRTPECAFERQCQSQRERRNDYALRVEGTEQVPPYLRV
jgi:hypothetical protein